MNTPERMEVEHRDTQDDAYVFEFILCVAGFERMINPDSGLVARAREVVPMRHARLGRYLDAVRR